MFPDEMRKRQERLSQIIYDLAEKMLDCEKGEHVEVIGKLQMIYKDGFRHSYSEIFPVILEMFHEESKYDVEYLMSNLEEIRKEVETGYSKGQKQYADIYSPFTKLCDHLNLQISEWSVHTKTESRTNDMNKRLQDAGKHLEKASEDLARANRKADSLQTELIAVLSIFAGIVVAFSGGFTFLGSVMTAIKDVKYFESVVLLALVCGMVIFNTIFLMMYLVSKITERNIYAKCVTEDCSCKRKGKVFKCNVINRCRRRLPYVFYFNVCAVVGIIIDVIIWVIDIKGYFA